MTEWRAVTRVLLASSCLLIGTAAYAQQPESPDPASIDCDHTFSKGAGAAQIQYCVSAHSNVMSFISPAGVESIRLGGFTDGYAVCSTAGVHGFDGAAAGESTWGPNLLISGPSSSGVGYARTTADGRIRLEHTFKLDSYEADVQVTVKIINVGATPLDNVMYKRYSDFDAAGAFTNRWTRSTDEVEALNEGFLHGISLNAISFATTHFTAIGFGNESNCALPPVPEASGVVGDHSAQVRYDVGSIAPLKSKTIKFVYKRK